MAVKKTGIKLIIFDLDGVLIDAKKIHFDTLNKSLSQIDKKFCITWDEHLNKYDGLKTNQKLDMLTSEKGLPVSSHKEIWEMKQDLTLKSLRDIKPNQSLLDAVAGLQSEGYKIACCSNSIRKTILTVLSKLDIIEYFDVILSNEDVNNSKPHPEIYWKAISSTGFLPEETLIIEDSPHGLRAAFRSKSNILRVLDTTEVTYSNIKNKIKNIENNNISNMPKWIDKKMNVLIPMAGAGSRFEKAGYTFPKPLIDVNGKPMIQVVVDNLNIEANYIFIVQKSHREKYNLDTLLNLIVPDCTIIDVDGITEGAACTALLAKEFINNDDPLFFANSDQFVEWESLDFMYKMQETGCDGGLVTFESTHPKWSFAKVDEKGFVTEVAEKNPISNIATVGYYYWKKGSDFVNYAEKMIEDNIRVNGEFYVCPVFNHAIKDSKKIRTFNVSGMWGLGTPEDLKHYLENYHIRG
jgi:HAD superfamily hydrolase (TIGR01509 family)